MSVNAVHPENAEAPIEVTFSGSTILVKAVHSENAEAPIEMTLSGRMICFS